MKKLAQIIANKISLELNYDEDKKQVIAYGLLGIIQFVVLVFFISSFGFVFGVAIEALIIFFSVSILRKYSGGVHSNSILICTIISVISCFGFSLIIKYLLLPLVTTLFIVFLTFFVYILSFIIIYKLAPVDNPIKPIKSDQKKARMRKGSFITLVIYLIISILFILLGNINLYYFSFNLSLLFGILWQTFSLTKLGKTTLKVNDFIFNKILLTKRR
jgi:accessory gene regulator B